MRWLFLFALVGCYKDPSFGDCEVACTTTCPGDLQCVAGACRVAGAMGQCTVMPGGDAGSGSGSGGDRDNDGVPDVVDNCPDKPNPMQGDEDGDHVGDVCDPCPVDQSTADPDSDGLPGQCDVHQGSGDAIALFDGFTGDPTQATPTQGGNGVWSIGGGVAAATNASGALSLLLWPAQTTGTAYVFATFEVTGITGGAVDVGVVDLANGGSSGMGCVLGRTATGTNATLAYNVASDTYMDTGLSPWTPNTSHSLLLTRRLASGQYTIYCTELNKTAMLNAPSSGPSWGLYASGANAKFDYILVVTAP